MVVVSNRGDHPVDTSLWRDEYTSCRNAILILKGVEMIDQVWTPLLELV